VYLTHHPEGSPEPTRWELQLGKLRTFDTEAIERVTGMDYGAEFKTKLIMGNIKARRALLWVMLRRTHPTLKFADVDFAEDELTVEQDRDELSASRKEIVDSDLDPMRRAALLARIDREIEDAPEAPGKAPANGSVSDTSTPSPAPSTSPSETSDS
jgi:hypothetical protein